MDASTGEGDERRSELGSTEADLASERAPIGRRADWRLLIPAGPRSVTAIVSNRDPVSDRDPGKTKAGSDLWNWLVEDGWTDDVADLDQRHLDLDPATVASNADVVLLRSPELLAVALAVAAPNATIVVELRRASRLRNRLRSELVREGFNDQRVYLATPDVERPLRLTPLRGSAGMRWMLGLFRLNRDPVPAILDRLAGPAAGVLRTPLGSMIGHQLLVARREASEVKATASATYRPGFHDLLPVGCDDAVLMTSGHDEGSRIILLPVGPESTQPVSVVKVSSRPAFNSNVENEVAVIAAQRAAAGESGQTAAAILPDIDAVFDHGPLRASREHYGGRMTAADVCYRSPNRRVEILDRVLEAVTELNLATGARSEPAPWTHNRFEELVSEPFERYRQLMGPQTDMERLVASLAKRSDDAAGLDLAQIQRHYDLGPWNVVVDENDRLTVLDWERAEPRSLANTGPVGADQLYFAKYWLHIAFGTQSVTDEMQAFEFLVSGDQSGDTSDRSVARSEVTKAMAHQLDRLGVNSGFVPILTVHLWLEKALYTAARRNVTAKGSVDPGDAAHYLQVLARHDAELLAHWPLK